VSSTHVSFPTGSEPSKTTRDRTCRSPSRTPGTQRCRRPKKNPLAGVATTTGHRAGTVAGDCDDPGGMGPRTLAATVPASREVTGTEDLEGTGAQPGIVDARIISTAPWLRPPRLHGFVQNDGAHRILLRQHHRLEACADSIDSVQRLRIESWQAWRAWLVSEATWWGARPRRCHQGEPAENSFYPGDSTRSTGRSGRCGGRWGTTAVPMAWNLGGGTRWANQETSALRWPTRRGDQRATVADGEPRRSKNMALRRPGKS
jgi:hypothetical protein